MTDMEKMQINLECLKLAAQICQDRFQETKTTTVNDRIIIVKYKAADLLEFVKNIRQLPLLTRKEDDI